MLPGQRRAQRLELRYKQSSTPMRRRPPQSFLVPEAINELQERLARLETAVKVKSQGVVRDMVRPLPRQQQIKRVGLAPVSVGGREKQNKRLSKPGKDFSKTDEDLSETSQDVSKTENDVIAEASSRATKASETDHNASSDSHVLRGGTSTWSLGEEEYSFLTIAASMSSSPVLRPRSPSNSPVFVVSLIICVASPHRVRFHAIDSYS